MRKLYEQFVVSLIRYRFWIIFLILITLYCGCILYEFEFGMEMINEGKSRGLSERESDVLISHRNGENVVVLCIPKSNFGFVQSLKMYVSVFLRGFD